MISRAYELESHMHRYCLVKNYTNQISIFEDA